MYFSEAPLILNNKSVTDAIGTIELNELPAPHPRCSIQLNDTTPLMKRLWRIALSDIEKNIVETEDGVYFGAGKAFGATVYTRDISYSGILGLNRLYPDVMLNSIRHSRKVRSELMFRVSAGSSLKGIDAPWIEEPQSEREFLQNWHTNSYTRRTDDVVWLWCTADLLEQNGLDDQWPWFYDTGKRFFKDFYQPFFDTSDGLYFGQASFVDIHFQNNKTTGYPQEWDLDDCVMVKSLSTNCLYVLGLNAMKQAASRLGRHAEALQWHEQNEALKEAIRKELRFADGSFAYFKDRKGLLQARREALGSALAVLSGVVNGRDAKRALDGYPVTDGGVPLFHPFFNDANWYHNNSSWPFVDTFFLKALEMTDGTSRHAQNAALLARTCIGDGTFHEVTDYRTREVKGSGSQLWTAAAFVDTCQRAGLLSQ
jgi:hypothetical protein